MKCQNCGEEIPDDSEFCLKCGAKIVKDPIDSNNSIIPVEVVDSDKNSYKHKSKIKKICIIIVIAILMIGGSTTGIIVHQQQEKAYQQHLVEVEKQKKTAYQTKLTNTVSDLIVQTYASETMCNVVAQKWHDAIFNDYGENFNTAIADAENALKNSEVGQNMKSENTKIQKEMQELQNPYRGYENTYQLVLQLYNEYTGLYNQATNPTGTLISYNNDISSKEDSFNTTLNQIVVVMPQIKSKIK